MRMRSSWYSASWTLHGATLRKIVHAHIGTSELQYQWHERTLLRRAASDEERSPTCRVVRVFAGWG